MPIISVGYKLDISENKNRLADILGIGEEQIKNEVYAGVFYGLKCKGDLWDTKAGEEHMLKWYENRKNIDQIFNVNTVYRNKQKTILVGEMRTTGNCNFYAFFHNAKNVTTTIQKKQLHQSKLYDKIDISRDPLKMIGTVYIDEKK